MALRGDYLTVRVQQHSSGVVNEVIAESTSVNVDFSAEYLETTSQTSGLFQSGIAGKVSGTISGDFLVASDGDNWTRLTNQMFAGIVIEVEVYRSSTKIVDCDGVLTSVSAAGGNSDQLVTGSYSITLSGDPAV